MVVSDRLTVGASSP